MPFKRRKGEILCDLTVVWRRRRMDGADIRRSKRGWRPSQHLLPIPKMFDPDWQTRTGRNKCNLLAMCSATGIFRKKDTKILWTMSDEKWWYGLVLRTFAKMCPALGIDKEVFTCHHKKHIGKPQSLTLTLCINTTLNPIAYLISLKAKVMAHATVGYCFTSSPEAGGEGVLIGLHRCQSIIQGKPKEA
jgi:hypothetical protein